MANAGTYSCWVTNSAGWTNSANASLTVLGTNAYTQAIRGDNPISYWRVDETNGTLAYDAVALVAALIKTQGAQRFSEEVLTNASGFTGIDGLFRFRPDGTNQRGLAVLRVTSTGGQVINPPPKAFSASGT